MIFSKTYHQLLWSYLAVSSILLGILSIAVRIIFLHNLTHGLVEELTTIAQSATTDIKVYRGKPVVIDDEVIVSNTQAVQWFDKQGSLIKQQGNFTIMPPFNPQSPLQSMSSGVQIVTIPVINQITKGTIGYVRVGESTQKLNHTLQRLDLGLGSGVAISLMLSSVGSIWLTRQAMKPIEKSFHKLRQFTADASHELRSPLMAIKSNAAVALKYSAGMRESDIEKFQAISGAATQMSELTEDLLILARTDRESDYQQEIVNLNLLLTSLTSLYQIQFEFKKIHVQINYIQDILILGNQVQLLRLLTNLIDNALRYTPEGGRIEICTDRRGGDGLCSIRDTGIGIAADNLERVFDRFWQADRSRSHEDTGFGLGLAIAQGIAQQHGGKITVTSELGVGSCFTVKLPLAARNTAT